MFLKAFFLGALFVALASAQTQICTLNDKCTTAAVCDWRDLTIWDNCVVSGTTTPAYPANNYTAQINTTTPVVLSLVGISVDAIQVNSNATVGLQFYGTSSVESLTGNFLATIMNETTSATISYGSLTVNAGAAFMTTNPIADSTAIIVNGQLHCTSISTQALTIEGPSAFVSNNADITISVGGALTIKNVANMTFDSLTLNDVTTEISTVTAFSITNSFTQLAGSVSITGATLTVPTITIADDATGKIPTFVVAASTLTVSNFTANVNTSTNSAVTFTDSRLYVADTMNIMTVPFSFSNPTAGQPTVINAAAINFVNTLAVTISGAQIDMSGPITADGAAITLTSLNGTIPTIIAKNTGIVSVATSTLTITTINIDGALSKFTFDAATTVSGLNTFSVDNGATLVLNGPMTIVNLVLGAQATASVMGKATNIGNINMANNSVIAYDNTAAATVEQHVVGAFAFSDAKVPTGTVKLTNAWLVAGAGTIWSVVMDPTSTFDAGKSTVPMSEQQPLTVQSLQDAIANVTSTSFINIYNAFTLVSTATPLFSSIKIVNGTWYVAGNVAISQYGSIAENNGTLVLQKGSMLTSAEAITLPSINFQGGMLDATVVVDSIDITTDTTISGTLTVRNAITLNEARLNVTGSYKQLDNATMTVVFKDNTPNAAALLQVGGSIVFGANAALTSTVNDFSENNKQTVNMLLATGETGIDIDANTTTIVNKADKIKDKVTLSLDLKPAGGNSTADDLYIVYNRNKKDVVKQGVKNNWKWIVIGVVGGLVVIAVITVVVRRYRKRHHHYQEV